MADILQRIVEVKRQEVEAARATTPLDELLAVVREQAPPRGFARALRARVLPHAVRGRDLPHGAVLRHRHRAVRGHSALRRRVPRGIHLPRHLHPTHAL